MISKAVYLFNTVYLIVPPSDAQKVVTISHGHINSIALNAEVPTLEVDIVAYVERIYQFTKKLVAIDTLSLR